ncbi:MAG: hypothetical protein P4M09_13025 [Devosia sp.]|nr:hypothetical protein [Devosia sp.]
MAACLALGFAIALVVVVAHLHAQQRQPTSNAAPSAEQDRGPSLKPGSPANHALSRLVLPSFQVLELLGGDGQGFSPAIRPKAVEYPDGVTLLAEDQRLRLTGISGIGRNGVCLAADGTKFACGLQARASLSLIISGKPVVCYRDQSLPPGADGFLCTSNGRDLAVAQVAAGFALPSRPSVQQLTEALESARTGRKGAWSGAVDGNAVTISGEAVRATRPSQSGRIAGQPAVRRRDIWRRHRSIVRRVISARRRVTRGRCNRVRRMLIRPDKVSVNRFCVLVDFSHFENVKIGRVCGHIDWNTVRTTVIPTCIAFKLVRF